MHVQVSDVCWYAAPSANIIISLAWRKGLLQVEIRQHCLWYSVLLWVSMDGRLFSMLSSEVLLVQEAGPISVGVLMCATNC